MSAHTSCYQHFLLKTLHGALNGGHNKRCATSTSILSHHLESHLSPKTYEALHTPHIFSEKPPSHFAQHSHLHSPLRPGRSYCPFEIKLSTATFAHICPREVIALCTTLLPSRYLALLAYDTHIRSILPRWATPPPGTTRHQTIFHLIRPFSRGTLTGTSLGIFLYRRCAFVLRRATLLP